MAKKTKSEIIEILEQQLLDEELAYIRRMDTIAQAISYVRNSTDQYAANEEIGAAHDRGELDND